MAVTMAVLTVHHLPGLDVRVVADLGRQGVWAVAVWRGQRLRGRGGLGGGGRGGGEGVVGATARVNRGRWFANCNKDVKNDEAHSFLL